MYVAKHAQTYATVYNAMELYGYLQYISSWYKDNPQLQANMQNEWLNYKPVSFG